MRFSKEMTRSKRRDMCDDDDDSENEDDSDRGSMGDGVGGWEGVEGMGEGDNRSW